MYTPYYIPYHIIAMIGAAVCWLTIQPSARPSSPTTSPPPALPPSSYQYQYRVQYVARLLTFDFFSIKSIFVEPKKVLIFGITQLLVTTTTTTMIVIPVAQLVQLLVLHCSTTTSYQYSSIVTSQVGVQTSRTQYYNSIVITNYAGAPRQEKPKNKI